MTLRPDHSIITKYLGISYVWDSTAVNLLFRNYRYGPSYLAPVPSRKGGQSKGRVRQSRCANSLAYFPHHQSQLEIQEVPWNTRKHLPFYCTVFPHAVLGLACPMSSWLLWCVTPQLPLMSLASGYSNCYVQNIEGDPTAKESSSGSPTPLSNGHLCSLC